MFTFVNLSTTSGNSFLSLPRSLICWTSFFTSSSISKSLCIIFEISCVLSNSDLTLFFLFLKSLKIFLTKKSGCLRTPNCCGTTSYKYIPTRMYKNPDTYKTQMQVESSSGIKEKEEMQTSYPHFIVR